MIKQTNLNHKGGLYLYSVHEKKLNELTRNISSLKFYLYDMFKNCPNSYFNQGPRSSTTRLSFPFQITKVSGREISELARYGLKINQDRFNSNHSKVQIFMIEHDSKTIAAEIPIWLEKNELPDFGTLFNSHQPLTGHIDLLRIEDNKIWIWDYKPMAIKEKYASTQIFLYALMLSQRTCIDLDKFRCGYFDEEAAFIFKPDLKLITKNMLVTEFI